MHESRTVFDGLDLDVHRREFIDGSGHQVEPGCLSRDVTAHHQVAGDGETASTAAVDTAAGDDGLAFLAGDDQFDGGGRAAWVGVRASGLRGRSGAQQADQHHARIDGRSELPLADDASHCLMAAGDLIHPGRFDADRGGIIQRDPATDNKVCMYFDDPGIFFTLGGQEVGDDVAERAGYDVKTLRRESSILREKREALEAIEAKYAKEREAVEGTRANPKTTTEGPFEIPLQTAPKPANKWVKPGGPEKLRATEFHEMSHRGRGVWDVFTKGTDEIVLEKVDEDTAVAFMVEQEAELAEQSAD